MTGRVRFPALVVVGGHGPEGKWPFAKVMRPAPQEALPDCFRRDNVSRRLPFVNMKSKDCTSRHKKGEYFLTALIHKVLVIGNRDATWMAGTEESTFLLQSCGRSVGPGKRAKSRKFSAGSREALDRP